MRALYVEDNEVDIDLTRRALARVTPPILFDAVRSVAEAKRRLTDNPARYQCVMCDLSLPDGDGFEVLKFVRENNLPLAVLAVTGTGDEQAVIRALKLGADDYIIKQRDYLDTVADVLLDVVARQPLVRHHQPLHVLYAENNSHDGQLALRSMAAGAPHITLDVVETGEEILSRLDDTAYDVLLLDYRLTSIDALEVVRNVRAAGHHTLPTVIVTGLGSEAVAAQALRLGVSDYIVKDETYLQRLPAVLEFAYTKNQLQALTLQRELLRTAQAAAETASRAKSQFLAMMSHELRTPMNAIVGQAFLLGNTDLSAQQRGYVQRIEQSLQFLLDMLNNALDLSKIESGRLELAQADFWLDALFERVRALFCDQTAAKALRFTMSIAPEVPLALRGDELRLQQILVNLIGNAIKFTDSGFVAVEAALLDRDEQRIELALIVRDSGIGLSAEQRRALFEPYTQADASIARRYGGTGLGLALCRQFATLMEGRADVTSTIGSGSEFRVTVKVMPAAVSAATDRPDAVASTDAIRGARVLVVDDNSVNQEVAQAYLDFLGAEADLCGSGAEAIERCRTQPIGHYAAILMDLQMPEMDGFDTVTVLRTLPAAATVPIIAVTADVWPDDRRRASETGMSDFLTKPVRLSELSAMLSRWIRR